MNVELLTMMALRKWKEYYKVWLILCPKQPEQRNNQEYQSMPLLSLPDSRPLKQGSRQLARKQWAWLTYLPQIPYRFSRTCTILTLLLHNANSKQLISHSIGMIPLHDQVNGSSSNILIGKQNNISIQVWKEQLSNIKSVVSTTSLTLKICSINSIKIHEPCYWDPIAH